MERDKIAILIPIYKPTLSPYEQVSIDRCFSVLGNYPIVYIAPESLDVSQIISDKAAASVSRFPDRFFKGIAGYNRLMLSCFFYKAFSNYEYMLIYQPDAYIFEDHLSDWCDRNYDYVGAPWIPKQKYENLHYKIGLKLQKALSRLFSIKTGAQNFYHVGNGGFSLRRIESFLKITESEEKRIEYYLSKKGPRFHEDIFWGVEVPVRYKSFKVPGWKEALGFAFDVRPELAFKYANNRLPMGCHGWFTPKHLPFWEKYILKRTQHH